MTAVSNRAVGLVAAMNGAFVFMVTAIASLVTAFAVGASVSLAAHLRASQPRR
jgi:hypothetical protein